MHPTVLKIALRWSISDKITVILLLFYRRSVFNPKIRGSNWKLPRTKTQIPGGERKENWQKQRNSQNSRKKNHVVPTAVSPGEYARASHGGDGESPGRYNSSSSRRSRSFASATDPESPAFVSQTLRADRESQERFRSARREGVGFIDGCIERRGAGVLRYREKNRARNSNASGHDCQIHEANRSVACHLSCYQHCRQGSSSFFFPNFFYTQFDEMMIETLYFHKESNTRFWQLTVQILNHSI